MPPIERNSEKNIGKYVGILIVVLVLITGVYFLSKQAKNDVDSNENPNEQVACTMEAKICPDGSSVGRSGPKCEFAECPGASNPEKSGSLTLSPGEQGKVGAMAITLNKITDDSRCPSGVECVWAGKVDVEVKLSGETRSETKTISSTNNNFVFDGYNIKIVTVIPGKEKDISIVSKDYKITFDIENIETGGK